MASSLILWSRPISTTVGNHCLRFSLGPVTPVDRGRGGGERGPAFALPSALPLPASPRNSARSRGTAHRRRAPGSAVGEACCSAEQDKRARIQKRRRTATLPGEGRHRSFRGWPLDAVPRRAGRPCAAASCGGWGVAWGTCSFSDPWTSWSPPLGWRLRRKGVV